MSNTHTHTQCPPVYTGWMEPLERARIERNPDKCRRGLPLIKSVGYEHREDAVGGMGAGNVKHKHTRTHTQCLP